MNDAEFRHLGITQSLIQEFEAHRLPRLFRLKDLVDQHLELTDSDIEFLDTVIHDTNRTLPVTIEYEDLHEFCLHVVHLYHDITTLALENERSLH